MSLITVVIVYLGVGSLYACIMLRSRAWRKVSRNAMDNPVTSVSDYIRIVVPLVYCVFVFSWPAFALLECVLIARRVLRKK